MNTTTLTDETFAKTVQEEALVLAEFGADWCPPCKAMKPILNELAQAYAGRAVVATVDVEANPVLSATYSVRNLPTFLVFRKGLLVERLVGALPKSVLAQKLNALLETGNPVKTS